MAGAEREAPTHLETRRAWPNAHWLARASVLYLAADTRLQVRLEQGRRQIYLLQGQVIFDVTHEASRAFRVDGGLAQVTHLPGDPSVCGPGLVLRFFVHSVNP